MSEVSQRYRRVADGFGARLEGVKADQWGLPTPCGDWDVRALVAHVVATQGRVVENVLDAPLADVDPSGDLPAQWSTATRAVSDALDDPDRAGRTVGGMFGEQPYETLVGRLLCSDTLFHTWDLARATGQEEQLDPDAVAKALEFLRPIDEAIRRPGGFAAKLDAPSGADEQTRLLCFGGRPPGWQSSGGERTR
jgi:uncharacterized protein (TIGR03086 family)